MAMPASTQWTDRAAARGPSACGTAPSARLRRSEGMEGMEGIEKREELGEGVAKVGALAARPDVMEVAVIW